MTNREEPWLQVVPEPGLSRKSRNPVAMSTTARDIYDVLYEAGQPLDAETIAAQTWERASSAARGYSLRKDHDRLEAERRRNFRTTSQRAKARTRHEIWASYIGKILRDRVRRRTLLVDDDGGYSPNPDKPPIAERVDGSVYRYTQEAWLETTRQERTTGEVHTMTMEVGRFLGGRSRDELLLVLEIFVDDLAGFGKEKRRPLNPRTVRAQLRWLLERPTTDESRAWLLHELTRRIYGATPGGDPDAR